MTEGTHGWSEYQLLVLAELQRHNAALEQMTQELSELKVELGSRLLLFDEIGIRLARLENEHRLMGQDMAALKVKAGIWGAISGFLTALGATLLYLLRFRAGT